LAILPVRVFVLVAGVADIGSSRLVSRVRVSAITFALGVEETLKVVAVYRAQIHRITVDSFVLFFQVESHFVRRDICALNLAVELLGVGGALLAGVGISHKPVSNASLFRSSIASFKWVLSTRVNSINIVRMAFVTPKPAISLSHFNIISIFHRLRDCLNVTFRLRLRFGSRSHVRVLPRLRFLTLLGGAESMVVGGLGTGWAAGYVAD